MIVKNEEENLALALGSIRKHVDEIIIVDTGSTDDTVKIAREFGAVIYHYVWNDDFSAARNFAIQQATKEWIFNLDADHILSMHPELSIKHQLSGTKYLGMMIDERSYISADKYQSLDRLLLFRNNLGFKYEGIIHEHPLKSIREYATKNNITVPFGSLAECWLNHSGHMDTENKLLRNLKLLQAATKKEDDNFHYWFKLLLTLKALGDKRFSENLLNAVYRVEKKNPPLTEAIVGIWGMFGDWVILGSNTDSVEKFYNGAAIINEKTKWNDIRLVWPYVKISIMNKNYDKAIDDLTKCIKSGIAPSHVVLGREERISPFFQLLKLVNSQKTAAEFVQLIDNLPELLEKTNLDLTSVLGFIKQYDQELFEAAYLLLNPDQKNQLGDLGKEQQPAYTGPLVSLCMIVKNEEVDLKRCLNSVKDVVDEIIIVDTGSEDDTLKVAQSFGATIIKFVWNGSFSDARNIALEQAKGKWILHLDADEELDKSSLNRLRVQVKETEADAINVVLRNYQPEEDMVTFLDEKQVRLFLNKADHRYQNKVHEQIIPSIAEHSGKFSESEIIINHYGYQANNEARAKRNLNLLEDELRETPQDAYLLFKTGETYKALKQWDKAAEFLTKAISNPQGNITNEIKEIIYLRLGQIELARDNHPAAQKYASACLRFNAKNAMAKYILAITIMYDGNTEKAIKLFQELKKTQHIHKLDLSEVDRLLQVFEAVKPAEKVLN